MDKITNLCDLSLDIVDLKQFFSNFTFEKTFLY